MAWTSLTVPEAVLLPQHHHLRAPQGVHRDSVTRQSKGESITRNGSDDNPAYVIEQEDGTTVLKLRSELQES